MKILEKLSLSNFINRRNDRDDGFTMLEMVIVLAIMAILMLLVSVGLEGYNNAADRIERNEVAESSYYAVQSYLAMAKRQGELEEFTNSVKIYNLSTYGDEMVLTNAQNKMVIESNYDGSDFDNYFANDYEVQHQNSEFVCMRLDAGDADIREANPLYTILFAALKDQDVMEHSFLVEFDSNSGIVRSVFYSKDTVSLDYHFLQEESSRQENESDVIDRNTASLDKKRQGYCGVLETNGYRDNFALAEPQNFMLVNNDRLYLTWDEANAVEPDFMSGKYQLDNLIYEVNLYNQDSELVATYELPRRDLTKDLTGTKAGILNYVDDMVEEIHDEGNTMTTRAGYTELAMEEAEDGIAGEKYYVLLECLDHTFLDNGYDFSADDEIYATLSLYYKENTVNAEKKVGFEETVVSNVESVYYADVLEDDGDKEFTLAYSRHLWNVRNGLYTEDYRLVADIDWGNIEERARDIAFTSTVFQDEEVHGLTHGLQGTFKGTKENPDGVAEVYRNATCHEIKGIHIYEDANIQVGLFAFNQGEISDVILSDFVVEGARHVGSMTGINEGTIRNVCVLDAEVNGNSELGGISGSNKGNIRDSVVASTVEVVLPAGNDKISTGTIGRYIGGAVGYQYATGTMNNISSGVLINETNGKALIENWEGKGGSASVTAKRVASDVTGIRAVGGIVGEIEYNAGEFKDLYNYAKLNATYVDVAERTARGDVESHMYQLFGGIVGKLETTNTLSNCENHAIVALDFKKNGVVCDADEIYTYITTEGTNGELFNNPRYIGGIAGYSIGTVVDCTTQYDVHGGLDEELAEYCKVVNREEGVYVGSGVGGIVGMNAGTLLYTDAYSAGNVNVVVRGLKSVGGLVGQAISGSVQNNSTELKVEGVVTSQLEHAGGVVAFASGGTIGGTYTNNGYVMGENAGGIAGYLGETITLANSNNTGVIYGRGNASTTRGYVGGVIGYNKGTANNCTNAGTVTVSHLLNAIPDTAPDYDETYADIGGVVGYNIGNVVNCHSRLNAEGTNYIVGNNGCYVGGLVGRNNCDGSSTNGVITTDTMEEINVPIIVGAIKQTDIRHRTGGVVGAAIGTLTLKDFNYTGKINVKSVIEYNDTGVGGIIGVLSDKQVISGCIFGGEITSNSNKTGGLVGNMAGGAITSTNAVQSTAIIRGTNHTGGVIGCHCATSSDSYVDVLVTRAQVVGTQYVGGCAGSVLDSSTFSLSGHKNYAHVSGVENIGGIAGLFMTVNSVEAVDVQNYGLIEGTNAVGGIIGKTSNNSDSTEYAFEKMVNGGTVVGNNATSSSVGGIIGKNASVVKLLECENNGPVGSSDENYVINYVGGFVGTNHRNISIVTCNNSGEITGTTCVAGFIGATYEQGNQVNFENCVNQSAASIIATKREASGFVARADGVETNHNKLTMLDCVNYAQVDAPNYIGGMLGHGFYSVLQISECHNYGVIGKNSEDRWAIGKAGGIAGYVEGSTGMNEGYVKNCTQNANIISIGANGEVAGIIGGMACPMLIENCSYGTKEQNYELHYVADAKRIGGIVGNSVAQLQIKNCLSHADMYGAYLLQQAGGIVGRISVDDYTIYGTTNYGNIGSNALEVTKAGGIVGHSNLDTYEIEATGTLENCVQLGQISNVSNHVGGMLGQNDFYSTTIINCQNGSEDVADSGKIYVTVANSPGTVGGLVGGSEGYNAADTYERTLTIASSNNYGEIFIDESAGLTRYVGGLVGNSTHYTMMGVLTDVPVAPCNNYGKIYGDAGATASYVGGILGRVTIEYGVVPKNEDDNAMSMIFYSNNYASIGENMAGISNAGGIIGNLDQPAGALMCNNTGKLYSISDIAGTNYGSGGIVGYASGMLAVLQGCVNGDSASGTSESIEPISSVQKIGGLIGGIGRDDGQFSSVSLGDCANYADIKMNYDTDYIGGAVGYQYSNSMSGIMNTNNYGNIVVVGADAEYVGGIVGRSEGMMLQLGVCYSDRVSTDVDRICRNYGDIRFEEGSKGRFVGGFLGRAGGTTFYGGYNEGDILADDNGSVVSAAGGIAGYLEGTTLAQDVEQMGNLKNVSFDDVQVTAGGIVAVLEGTATIKNTDNGSQQARDSGTEAGYVSVKQTADNRRPEAVGGMIGRNTATLTMTECNNYGDINSSYATYDVGGIIGRSEGVLTMGSATDTLYGAKNYGNIKAVDGAEMCQTGGVIGKATNSLKLYQCENYGNLVPDNSGYVIRAGGMIGCLDGDDTRTAELEQCSQKATIYNVKGDGYAGAGGIVGYANIVLTVNNGTNDGPINMLADVQRVGGIIGGSNKKVTLNNCTNNSVLSGVGKVEFAGGIIGSGSAQVLLENCVNNADITGTELYAVGGMVGRLVHTGGENTINQCTQLGNIYNVRGSDATAGAGGIVGFNESVTVITNCVNGQNGATDKGKIVALDGAVRVGGIVGASWIHATTLDNCTNYGSVDLQGVLFRSGGIVGAANCVLSVDRCTNYMGFSLKNTCIALGGMVGQSIGTIQVGLSGDGVGFVNHGDLFANGGAITDVGGVVGLLEGGATIHKAENYGDILVQTTGDVINAAGICGHVVGVQDVELFACGSFANTRGGNHIGGLIGHALGSGQLHVENCYAIGDVRSAGAHKGALIAYINPVNVLVLKDAYGRADITDGNFVINFPENWLAEADCTFRGGTNGEFSQNVYNTMCTVLGIENQWIADDWYENVRYLMSNYVAAN